MNREEIQQHYIVTSNQVHYEFNSRGAMVSARCKVVLKATSPGVQHYYAGFSYAAEQRRGLLRVRGSDDAEPIRIYESDSGALQVLFQLAHPIYPDDDNPYELSFMIIIESDTPSLPRLRFHAAAGNYELFLNAQFAEPMVPSALWRFGVPDPVDAEHPALGTQLMPIDRFLYVHCFEGLVPGWCYGFGWAWPAAHHRH